MGLELIGAVAAVLVPLPFIFYSLGKKIRARSTFTPAPDIAQDKRRDEESAGESVGENSQVDEKKAEDS
jgi:DHA1 family multidrug resistance protein-like MFS transporter